MAAGNRMHAKPFLAREALVALMMAPPLLALLTSSLSGALPSLDDAVRCLLASWIGIVLVGFVLHQVVNWSGPRLAAALPSTALGIGAIAGIAVASIVIGTALLLPQLVRIAPHVQDNTATTILRAVATGGLYVIVARAVAVLRERSRQSEERAVDARLDSLHAHASPHFLFNALNTVASLIPIQPDRAEAMLERLGGVLQYSIASKTRVTVSLEEELATVRDYLDIEQMRFGTRLRSRILVSQELRSQRVPPMLLQPLVENAVLHGLASREQGGEIQICGRVEGSSLILTVSDDGVGPGGSHRRGTKTGLSSVRERLALTYGDAGGLAIRAREGGGFECELRVPRFSH